MEIEIIDVYSLKDVSYLSPVRCADLSEAAAVCLDNKNHLSPVKIEVQGSLESQFHLIWQKTTQQIRDSRSDLENAVEAGAYCLAILIIEQLTEYTAIKQSVKGTGFDYWLGKKNDISFQQEARLEVSGILKGTKGQINQRLKEKINQTRKSDSMNIPAFVVIVEFGTPLIKIQKR